MRAAAIALFVLCLAVQIFVPPFIGLANNGDFGKVAGQLSLNAVDDGASNFIYFQPDYVHATRNFWRSPYHTSETALAWIALHAAGATNEGARFDIRALGAAHAAFWIAAFAVLLAMLRGRMLLLTLPAALVFTDVCYAAYLNTFYMDTAALCGLFLMAASAAWIATTEHPATTQVALCAGGALLYATSKTQHALWFALPVAFLVWTGARTSGPPRLLALLASALVLAASLTLLVTADPTNRDQALFNKLLFQIGTAPDGAAALRELGVREDELRYAGTHSYMPGSPASDRSWVNGFYRRTGYLRLAAWYLRHPNRAAAMLRDVLYLDAPATRQENLSNFRQIDGQPPGARTSRFAWWSTAQSWTLAHFPWLVPIWYAAFVTVALLSRQRLAWVGLGIAALGAGQFAVAALADCLETGRHLLMFHACTDLTLLMGIAWAIPRFRRAR